MDDGLEMIENVTFGVLALKPIKIIPISIIYAMLSCIVSIIGIFSYCGYIICVSLCL